MVGLGFRVVLCAILHPLVLGVREDVGLVLGQPVEGPALRVADDVPVLDVPMELAAPGVVVVGEVCPLPVTAGVRGGSLARVVGHSGLGVGVSRVVWRAIRRAGGGLHHQRAVGVDERVGVVPVGHRRRVRARELPGRALPVCFGPHFPPPYSLFRPAHV